MNQLENLAFGALEQNTGWLTAYFVSATGNHTLAKDLVQETYHQAVRSAKNYDPSRPFAAWLRGIASHVLVNHYRKSGNNPLLLENSHLEVLAHEADEAAVRNREQEYTEKRVEWLRECISQLSRRLRNMIKLKYFGRKLSKAIAEQMNMTEMAVNMALSRARSRLQECVERKARPYNE
ncbi:MAG: sigma-70 family RNA polymerase sigma factor [Kiritimatiellia bacterium]